MYAGGILQGNKGKTAVQDVAAASPFRTFGDAGDQRSDNVLDIHIGMLHSGIAYCIIEEKK